MRYQARAPLRIDFGGGWTDVPEYAEREGGAVLNAAITRYVHGSLSRPEARGFLDGLRSSRSTLKYSLEAPAGAGLGASAAQTVLWVTLVRTSIANVSTRQEIAEIACQVASSLGIVGGKQDEYASALGGIQFLSFGETVRAERLEFSEALESALCSRLVLVYSGEPRLSASIHAQVWARYREGNTEVREALTSLREIAQAMRSTLLSGDLESLGALMNDNWRNQKTLHPSVTNPRLDAIFDLSSDAGAIGGKACGAGGGGCLLFLTGDGQRERLVRTFQAQHLRTLDFGFDQHGVHLGKGSWRP